jgi:pyruvate/2-oxoglutarate dehydrogenase complex dihydrolipoamide dehydrogenase (E3) component
LPSNEYDFIIIGSGAAGLTAAEFASKIGIKVLLVEAERVGGDCTWTGCIPSKSLIHCASIVKKVKEGKQMGLFASELDVNFIGVKKYVKNTIETIADTESPDVLRKEGIDVILGKAKFVSEREIEVNDITYSGKKFLVATGAKPFMPPVEGLDEIPFLTYETIFDIEKLPDHLIVMGGGPIGCELAQAFRRLGSKVTVMEGMDRLLPRDDPEASRILTEAFKQEKIEIFIEEKVVKVLKSENNGEITVITANGVEVRGSDLLVVVGRKPNLEGLDLEIIGVELDDKGNMVIDKNLRTSRGHVYAAGDCTGGLQFTHLAGYQGFVATRNAFLPGSSEGVVNHVPWTTFTDPEVAHVGLSNVQDHEQPSEVMICFWPLDKVDRAITDGNTRGFIKIFYKKNGEILGVTVVAPRAGEMIQEWVMAMKMGIKIGDVANVIHVYPTYSTGAQQAAYMIRVNELLQGMTGKMIKKLARFMR